MRQTQNGLTFTASKQKVQRHKANEIILKIIRHNGQDNSNESICGLAESNEIGIELPPARYFNNKQ